MGRSDQSRYVNPATLCGFSCHYVSASSSIAAKITITAESGRWGPMGKFVNWIAALSRRASVGRSEARGEDLPGYQEEVIHGT
jgi:hypothetical protein